MTAVIPGAIDLDSLTVACVQQRLRLPQTEEAYHNDLRRFARAAQNKRARLIVFPELAGMLLGVPLLADFRSGLLLRADQARRRNASLWQRLSGAAAERLALTMNADLRQTLGGLLDLHAELLWAAYCDTFGALAQEFEMTVAAPSAYLPDPLDGVVRNLSALFGPDGELLGTQAKVMLHPDDEDLAQPGRNLKVISTEVGQIGLMLGNDMLYPEIGRLLAYQGAEMLIGQAASPGAALYNKLRAGMLARMQDNQLFGTIAFLVGHNDLTRRTRDPFVGKSAVFAPQDITPRFSGVLVEMGNQRSEGVITAEWNFQALRTLWESSDTPLRSQLPLGHVSDVLADLYMRLSAQTTDVSGALPEQTAPEDGPPPAKKQEWLKLDDLPVFASITRRWPLNPEAEIDASSLPLPGDETDAADSSEFSSRVRTEDETDEMDALPRRPKQE